MSSKLFLLCLLIGFPWSGIGAHEAHHRAEVGKTVSPDNEIYSKEIEPIFRKKCFDCHSAETVYPSHYKLPLAKQIIDYDIREGRKHLDMTEGFPFKGHHTVDEQLESLAKAVKKNTMPLRRYRLLHPGSGLTAEEREKILDWVKSRRANPAL